MSDSQADWVVQRTPELVLSLARDTASQDWLPTAAEHERAEGKRERKEKERALADNERALKRVVELERRLRDKA